MEEKAIELIENLANQLGVAVPYLWEVLVKQAHVDAISSIFSLGIFLVLLVAFIFLLVKFGLNKTESFEVIFFCGMVIFGILFMFQMVKVIFTLPTALFNPEYWALTQLMNMM
jgi:hypothetical protein